MHFVDCTRFAQKMDSEDVDNIEQRLSQYGLPQQEIPQRQQVTNDVEENVMNGFTIQSSELSYKKKRWPARNTPQHKVATIGAQISPYLENKTLSQLEWKKRAIENTFRHLRHRTLIYINTGILC